MKTLRRWFIYCRLVNELTEAPLVRSPSSA